MKKLLFVDDQADIRELIRVALEFEGYELHEAADGREALALLQAVRPDLVLLDVMMPGGIDGIEVCRQAKADPALRHIPIVLLTARGQQADRDTGRAAGADAYVVKPFSPLELVRLVAGLLTPAP